VTLASLRAAHPEFDDTPDDVLSSAISQAENQIDEGIWGDTYDDGVMLLACHLAAATAYGGGGRLSEKSRRSIYYQDYLDLRKDAGSSWRLA